MVVFLICLSWNVLLGLLLWWHREQFFGWNTVGANVGGYPKIWIRSPNTRERENSKHVYAQRWCKRRLGVSCRLHKFPKLWILLHVPSCPPFIRRGRDFTFRQYPWTQRIFLVWTHTQMSFTSHTFTSLPLVHTLNPDFWDDNFDFASCWFVNILIQEVFTHRDSRTRSPTYSRISQIPEVRGFAGSWLWVFTNSQLQGRAGSRLRAIARSRLRDFESSGVQLTAHSWLRDFVNSRLQIFVSSLPLKTCITNFINLNVSRVTGFPEFPNTYQT
jgi:hypothetical protein